MVAFDDVSPAVQIGKMTVSVLKTAPGWNFPVMEKPPVGVIKTAEALDATLGNTGPVLKAGGATDAPVLRLDWTADPNLPDILKAARPNMPPPVAFPTDQTGLTTFTEQFRNAATGVIAQLQNKSEAAPDLPPLGGTAVLDGVRTAIQAKLNPENTIQARLSARLPLQNTADPLQPFRAGPQFPQPMYAPLADLSPEWMLPGISNIPIDCATLLKPNAKFIESYMIGLNQELSNELLWREFPAYRNATFFQYFWGGKAPDIQPIAGFGDSSNLGDSVGGQATGAQYVFLIRANLFRRYPNAVVSAMQAQWSGNVRVVLPDTRIYPDFRGNIGQDLTFFGFTINGDPFGSPTPADQKPGWYFVIEEHITEPRFGLEPAPPQTQSGLWDDFSWPEAPKKGAFLDATTNGGTRENVAWKEDAASMAYILLREPVRVAMHALALLGPQS
jgi:hypothetical protein